MQFPYLSLLLLWLAYTLLGWYLAAHHIIWIFGFLIAFAALYLSWKTNPLLQFIVRLSSQGLFVVLTSALIFSVLIASSVALPMLLILVVIPLVATILAEVEMRYSEFSQLKKLVIFSILAGLGLVIGETIDLVLLPSIRY